MQKTTIAVDEEVRDVLYEQAGQGRSYNDVLREKLLNDDE